MSIQTQSKGLEACFFSICKGEKKNRDLVLATQRPIPCIRNYAKNTCGLFAKIIGKVSALTAL